MRILSGYIPATNGRAVVAGYDVFSQALAVRRCVGYLPENVPLYREMTVQSYLRFVAEVKGVPRQQRIQQVGEAIGCGLQTETEGQLQRSIECGDSLHGHVGMQEFLQDLGRCTQPDRGIGEGGFEKGSSFGTERVSPTNGIHQNVGIHKNHVPESPVRIDRPITS